MILDSLKFKFDKSEKTSLVKTISWRIIGTIDTMVISYILTGRFDIAFSIGGVEVVSKMLLYYFHERAWIRILNTDK